MSDEKKEAEKTPEERIKAFNDEYEALCKKYGFAIAFEPQWKKSLDTGTFSLVIVPILVKLS